MLLISGLIGLGLLILLALGIVWLTRALISQNQPVRREGPAQAELRRRYAAGHIDRDEYLRHLEDLGDS